MPKYDEYVFGNFEESPLDTTGMAQLLKERDEKKKRRRVEKTVVSDKLLRAKMRYARQLAD